MGKLKSEWQEMNSIKSDSISEERNIKYDYIRVIAMFLVIGVHSWGSIRTFGSNDATMEWLNDMLERLFAMGVPLFFALSGALLLKEKYSDFLAFYKKRAITVIIPMLIYAPIYVIYSDWKTNSLSVKTIVHYFQKVVCGQVHGTWWFVYTILGIYLITPFLSAMLSALSDVQKKTLVCIIYMFLVIRVMLSFVNWEFGIVDILFCNGAWLQFIIGYFGNYLGQKQLSAKKTIMLLCGAIVAFVLYLLGYDNTGIMLNSAVLIVFIVAARTKTKQKENALVDKIIVNVSRKSYGIYLIHAAVLSLLLKLYTDWKYYILGKLSLLLLTVAFVSYVISITVDKVVIGRMQKYLRRTWL